MTENCFNLINEAWIPIANIGQVSLKDVFTHLDYSALGGNPIQKIALMKLLLAIAQAAYTPADEADWKQLGTQDLSEKCLAYLEKWHDSFYLYGEQPFLQMPKVENLIETRTAKETAQATTNGKKLEAE